MPASSCMLAFRFSDWIAVGRTRYASAYARIKLFSVSPLETLPPPAHLSNSDKTMELVICSLTSPLHLSSIR